MKRKIPTHTSLIEEYLRGIDDFASLSMIVQATGSTRNQIQAALFNLRHYRAIDVVVNPDGVGWWYALPKEEDTRIYAHSMRAEELKPRRRSPRVRAKGWS